MKAEEVEGLIEKYIEENARVEIDVKSESYSGSYLKVKMLIGNKIISEDLISVNQLLEP